MNTVGSRNRRRPHDLSGLRGITDPQQFNREFHRTIRENLQAGGFLPPTEGLTVPIEEPEDTGGFFNSLIQRVFTNSGAEAFDTPDNRYQDQRFDFLAAEANYSLQARPDYLGRPTIGYGFNLADPELRNMARDVLNLDDNSINSIVSGERGISQRDARVLYEAQVARAEQLVRDRVGKDTPLTSSQRTALVSLAMQDQSLIGPNLSAAVREGRWEDAVSEIRERSNAHGNQGIAQRRNREADLFANFNDIQGQQNENGESFSLASLFNFGGQQESPQTDPQQAEGQAAAYGQGIGDLEYGGLPDPNQIREAAPPAQEGLELINANGEAVGTVNAVLGAVPAHMRMFVTDVISNSLGIDQTENIRTSDMFTNDELQAMVSIVQRSIAANGGKMTGAVGYEDGYQRGYDGVRWNQDETPMMNASGEDSVRLTLGAFNYEINDQGELIITDSYNFNDAEQLRRQYPSGLAKVNHLMGLVGEWGQSQIAQSRGQEGVARPAMGLYGIIRRIGALYGSAEGEGSRFRINLGVIPGLTDK